jgi:hypothetical protein
LLKVTKTALKTGLLAKWSKRTGAAFQCTSPPKLRPNFSTKPSLSTIGKAI